jgi:hypothetical protein
VKIFAANMVGNNGPNLLNGTEQADDIVGGRRR